MNTRHLFLVGYDIRENPIRRRALRDVQHHALGGQKSFYECWLSVAELQTLLAHHEWATPQTLAIISG